MSSSGFVSFVKEGKEEKGENERIGGGKWGDSDGDSDGESDGDSDGNNDGKATERAGDWYRVEKKE